MFFTSYWSNARGYWSLRPQNNLIKEYMTFYCTLQALYNLSTGNNCLKEGKRTRGQRNSAPAEGRDPNYELMTRIRHSRRSYFCMYLLPLTPSICLLEPRREHRELFPPWREGRRRVQPLSDAYCKSDRIGQLLTKLNYHIGQ